MNNSLLNFMKCEDLLTVPYRTLSNVTREMFPFDDVIVNRDHGIWKHFSFVHNFILKLVCPNFENMVSTSNT